MLSIAAGVFAVGAMFGMSDQLLSGMDAAHQAVSPSHINMYVNPRLDRDAINSLKNIEGVDDIEPYNQILVRYKIRPQDEWKEGIITMRDDYAAQKFDLTQLREGNWPGQGDLAIERLSAQYFRVGIGDSVIFKIGKTEKALPIGGKVRYPFVPPPQFGGQAFFFASGAGMERFDVPEGRFSSLLIRVKPYSLEYAKEVASNIKDHLAKQGVGVGSTIYQDPDKHWGRFFIEGMTLVLQVLAVISLLSSAVLILNTLTALITQQTDQIGILKAIGGSSSMIIRVYLTGVLIYGLLALCVSLPLGMFVAFGLSQWMLNFFNIDYETFRFSNQAVILSALSAIVVPLLAALWPVWNGASITVREAIASYGLGGDFGSNRFDRAVERLGARLLPSHYATALGNLFRRKARLILTQFALITAGAMFLIVMTLSASITATLDGEFARSRYDLFVSFSDIQRSDRVVEMAQSVEGVDKAVLVPGYSVAILKQGQRAKEAGAGATLRGLPIEDNFFTPIIVAGRWLRPDDGRVVVMSRDTAERNNIRVDDTITLNLGEFGKDEWQVIGLYQLVFGGSFSSDDLYATQSAVFDVTKRYNQGRLMYVRLQRDGSDGHATMIKLQDKLEEGGAKLDLQESQGVATLVRKIFEGRGIKVGQSMTLAENRKFAESQFGIVTSMLLALAVIVAIVGGIGLMGALSISVVERTKEIGVLRAVGARSPTIMGMFVMEGILQGLISWAIAVPISFLLGRSMAVALGQVMFSANLDYAYNYSAVLIWLIVVIVISILAAILPARNATRISVRASLAYA